MWFWWKVLFVRIKWKGGGGMLIYCIKSEINWVDYCLLKFVEVDGIDVSDIKVVFWVIIGWICWVGYFWYVWLYVDL